MPIRTLLFTLAVCATVNFTGCGRGEAPLDSGPADQAVSTTCAVNNGGCSISPMVLCGTSGTGEVLCGACPTGYVGDGRVCTSIGAMDECALGIHNCSRDATCTDTVAAYRCLCLGGYYGDGVVCQQGDCFDVGQRVRYRLDSLTIPTSEQAMHGDVVGHDVDNAGGTCSVPDFVGNADNSLIGLADALLAASPDDIIDLQAVIDDALNCPAGSVNCTRLDLIVSLGIGTVCAVLAVENGDGDTLARPIGGTIDSSGNLRARLNSLDLTIPYDTGTGTVDIALAVQNVIITGTLTQDSLANVVIGGALPRTTLESTIMQLIAQLGGDTTFDDIAPILESRYDIQIGGQCAALSVGFTAAGTLYTPPST